MDTMLQPLLFPPLHSNAPPRASDTMSLGATICPLLPGVMDSIESLIKPRVPCILLFVVHVTRLPILRGILTKALSLPLRNPHLWLTVGSTLLVAIDPNLNIAEWSRIVSHTQKQGPLAAEVTRATVLPLTHRKSDRRRPPPKHRTLLRQSNTLPGVVRALSLEITLPTLVADVPALPSPRSPWPAAPVTTPVSAAPFAFDGLQNTRPGSAFEPKTP